MAILSFTSAICSSSFSIRDFVVEVKMLASNGVPDIKEIPPDKLESLLAVLEMQISKYYEKDK